MTAIYVLPFNPVKNNLSAAINTYMTPLFLQNWQLFAPDPLSSTVYIYVQAKDEQGNESSWVDISSQLYDYNHKNRFSPYNRLVRLGSGAYLQATHVDELANRVEQKKLSNGISENEENLNEEKDLSEYQKDGIQKLYNLGWYYVMSENTNENVESIRVRISREQPVPFTERKNSNYEREETYFTFDWEPVNELRGGSRN